jgi:hypothetical protein
MGRHLMVMRTCALALAAACICQGTAASVAGPIRWAPLQAAELTALYSGKTWQWKDGAAYFAPDGRFKAWSRAKGKLTEGFGIWEARPDGVMCFDASWQTVSPNAQQTPTPKVETCFSHGVSGNAIAQRKLPDGAWYYFRHTRPTKSDEFFKLRAGDHTRLEG